MDYPTRSKILEQLDYNPDTGEFTWKTRSAMRVAIGAIAGTINGGRRRTQLLNDNGKRVNVYNCYLVWIVEIGAIPPRHRMIHIEDKLNDHITNLKLVPIKGKRHSDISPPVNYTKLK